MKNKRRLVYKTRNKIRVKITTPLNYYYYVPYVVPKVHLCILYIIVKYYALHIHALYRFKASHVAPNVMSSFEKILKITRLCSVRVNEFCPKFKRRRTVKTSVLLTIRLLYRTYIIISN